jgi:hypothetical protein
MTGMPIVLKRTIFPRGNQRRLPTPEGAAPYEDVFNRWYKQRKKSTRNGLIHHQFKKVDDREG